MLVVDAVTKPTALLGAGVVELAVDVVVLAGVDVATKAGAKVGAELLGAVDLGLLLEGGFFHAHCRMLNSIVNSISFFLQFDDVFLQIEFSYDIRINL